MKSRQGNGFTLVELLVVIVTLTILAATILPVLASNRASTRSVGCLENLHRLGTAVHMYAADNSDEMVYPNWGSINRFTGWLFTGPGTANLQVLNQVLGTINGSPVCPPANLLNANVQKFVYQKGALYPYTQQANTYWCPAQDAANNQSQWFRNVFQNNGPNNASSCDIYSTYIMNGATVDFPDQQTQTPSALRQYKLSNLHFRGNYVLMWEPPYTSAGYNDGASKASTLDGGQPGQGHATVCPLLRIDGASEMQQYNFVTSQMMGFANSPQGVVTTTPFENEFFYAHGFIDGGFADANGAPATR